MTDNIAVAENPDEKEEDLQGKGLLRNRLTCLYHRVTERRATHEERELFCRLFGLVDELNVPPDRISDYIEAIKNMPVERRNRTWLASLCQQSQ